MLLGVAIASVIAGNLLRNRDYGTAWVLLRIAGILSLPAGIILLITGFITMNILKKVADQEFREMLNKSKPQG